MAAGERKLCEDRRVIGPHRAGDAVVAATHQWVCYLLRCADDTLYCGISNDLKKRLASHNAGTAAKYTRARGPVVLVFVEVCADRSSASKRELAIKKLSRAEKLILVAPL